MIELKAVFGEWADQFIEFCDGQAEGEEDKVLTFEEFKFGIINDCKDLDDDAFKATWIDRMNGCIKTAQEAKEAGIQAQADELLKDVEKPTLVYFPVRARGEPIRLVAALSGFEMDDVMCMGFDVWGKMKSDEVKFLPLLKEAGGKKMIETGDICKYIAGTSDKVVVDELQDEIFNIANTEPVSKAMQMLNLMPQADVDASKKAWAEECAPVINGALAKIPEGKSFFGGDKVGYGDILLFQMLDNANYFAKDELKEALGEGGAKCKAFFEAMAGFEGIQAWMDARPKFGEFGFPGSYAQNLA